MFYPAWSPHLSVMMVLVKLGSCTNIISSVFFRAYYFLYGQWTAMLQNQQNQRILCSKTNSSTIYLICERVFSIFWFQVPSASSQSANSAFCGTRKLNPVEKVEEVEFQRLLLGHRFTCFSEPSGDRGASRLLPGIKQMFGGTSTQFNLGKHLEQQFWTDIDKH